MQRDPGVLGQPAVDVVVLVGVVVVEHDVQPAARVGLGDELEEVQELGLAVAVIAAVGDRAGRDLQRGEQRGGAVALVVVGGLLGQPGPDGQDRLGAVERLDLGLLVDAEHDRVLAAGPGTGRRRRGPWPPVRGRWRT